MDGVAASGIEVGLTLCFSDLGLKVKALLSGGCFQFLVKRLHFVFVLLNLGVELYGKFRQGLIAGSFEILRNILAASLLVQKIRLRSGKIKRQADNSITKLAVAIDHHNAGQFISHLLLGGCPAVPINCLAEKIDDGG